MATVRHSLVLDPDLDEELTRRYGAEGKARFVNDAARVALARARMIELLDRMDAEVEPVPHDVLAEVAGLPRPR